LHVAASLADELLGQIREVVSALRVHDGLDLRAALHALALPVPGATIEVAVDEGLRIDDVDQAGALLRCAQEGITNALRHGRAGRITVALRRNGDHVELTVDNAGAAPRAMREGNGLTGMRERLQACGGTLAILPTPPRGMRLVARVPGAA
jgi:signal transduction histidine kinase